jgi:hypothetical protein
MKAAQTLGALAVVCAGAGCASEPGVQSNGADSYVVNARAPEGNASLLLAQNAALEEARAFCTSRGKRFLAIGDHVGTDGFAGGITYSVRFRCPEPGSPDLPRPLVDQMPEDLL